MTVFFQAVGLTLAVCVLLSVIRQGEFRVLLLLACSCAVVGLGLVILRPLMEFMDSLTGRFEGVGGYFAVLFKVLGIVLVSEFTVAVCADTGNSALGKLVQLVTGIVSLWLGIPVFRALLTLMDTLLGGI